MSAPIRSPNTGHSPEATDAKLLKLDSYPDRRLLADNRLMTFLKTGSLVEVMFRTHAICCSGSFKAASLTRIIVC
ncbi:MAG: hypothetical protein KBE22_14800, partial [Candidatus Accumulibacter sp.]|nr:hypothetical protein [Accumulibacter sp.]